MSDIAEAVRRWAKGVYASEAGAELLIRHGKAIYEGAPWLIECNTFEGDPRMVRVDVDALVGETGVWSSGEQRIIAIAASMLGGPAADLSDVLAGLDRKHLRLVLAAVAHANGSHEGTELVTNDEGGPVSFRNAGALYAWPESR